VVSLIGGGVAGGLWYFGIASATAGSVPLPDDNTRPFDIHGIALGMTAEAIRDSHPRISIHWRHDGGHVGEFVEAGVTHMVWFAPGWKPGRVYRIRYRQIFPAMTRAVVLEHFASQFGAPVSSSCGTAAGENDAVPCSYEWTTRNGMALEVLSRNVTGPSGESVTVLTVTANDAGVAEAISPDASHAGNG
jgi:hypothetical protein